MAQALDALDAISVERDEARAERDALAALLREALPILRARYDSLPLGVQSMYASLLDLEKRIIAAALGRGEATKGGARG